MFKPSTLKERQIFYNSEFNVKKVIYWFKIKPQLFALDLGSETKIIKIKKELNTLLIFKTNFKTFKKILLKYLPEDIYYDRNIYKNPEKNLKNLNFKNCLDSKDCLGQELAFDLDSDNIKCNCKDKLCPKCLEEIKNQTLKLYKELKKDFKKLEIVYSGRGYHIHVYDKKAYKLTIKERIKLNKKLKSYPIDPWVSSGTIRLMRLPFSLNAQVSRIVLPLKIKEIKNFNPLKDKRVIPNF